MNPALALNNMKKLHEERKVFAVIGNIGTATAAVSVPYTSRNKILFFGPFSGANLLRYDPPNRYVFNYRAGYDQEIAAICKYLLDDRKLKPREIAVFSQNDSYGDAGYHGVVKALRPLVDDVKNIVHVRHTRDPDTIDVSTAVAEMQALAIRKFRAVIMASTYEPAAEFIHERSGPRSRDLIFANVLAVGTEGAGATAAVIQGKFRPGGDRHRGRAADRCGGDDCAAIQGQSGEVFP